MNDNEPDVNRDRRVGLRRRVLKAGRLAFNNKFSGLQCVVRDISDAGARIKVDHAARLPDVIELIIEIDGLYAKSRVAWRKGGDAGLKFIEAPRLGAKLRQQSITPRV